MAVKAKTSKQPVTILRRYTSLAALLALLQDKKLTLLSPGLWEDRNDAFYMGEYKTKKRLQTLLALCFTESDETYHHWRVFSQGMDGVCLEFDRERLLAAFANNPHIRSGSVEYYELRKLGKAPPTIEELPFSKRFPYQDEKEFRIVYVDNEDMLSFKEFDIDLAAITRINLSPWMPEPLSDSVKATIRSIEQIAPNHIALYNERKIEKEFLDKQDLMLISIDSWRKALETQSIWLSNTPSALIIKP